MVENELEDSGSDRGFEVEEAEGSDMMGWWLDTGNLGFPTDVLYCGDMGSNILLDVYFVIRLKTWNICRHEVVHMRTIISSLTAVSCDHTILDVPDCVLIAGRLRWCLVHLVTRMSVNDVYERDEIFIFLL